MRRAAKVDANQPALVAQLRAAGYHVAPTHALGRGFPDLIVTGVRLPQGDVAALLVEVKDAHGRLTADEAAWHAAYPDGGPLIVAHGVDDVLAWFGRVDVAARMPSEAPRMAQDGRKRRNEGNVLDEQHREAAHAD